MMGGGHGRFGNALNQETLKPHKLSETLGRLGSYFGRFWHMIVLAVLFVGVVLGALGSLTMLLSPEVMQTLQAFILKVLPQIFRISPLSLVSISMWPEGQT